VEATRKDAWRLGSHVFLILAGLADRHGTMQRNDKEAKKRVIERDEVDCGKPPIVHIHIRKGS